MLNNLSKLHVYCFILSLATSVSYRYPENERFSRSNWPVLKLKPLNKTRTAHYNIPNLIKVKNWLYYAENKENEVKKSFGSGGIRTHAPEETGALNQRLRPLGHATAGKVCFRYIKYAEFARREFTCTWCTYFPMTQFVVKINFRWQLSTNSVKSMMQIG